MPTFGGDPPIFVSQTRPRTFLSFNVAIRTTVVGSRNIYTKARGRALLFARCYAISGQRKIMADVTDPPAKRRKCDGPSKSGEISHQIHDRRRAPTTQRLSLPWDPPPQPGETVSHVVLERGMSSMPHLAGAYGRQIQPFAAVRTRDLALPSPPPEDEGIDVLTSLEGDPFPPVPIATWTQGLSLPAVLPFGRPGELDKGFRTS